VKRLNGVVLNITYKPHADILTQIDSIAYNISLQFILCFCCNHIVIQLGLDVFFSKYSVDIVYTMIFLRAEYCRAENSLTTERERESNPHLPIISRLFYQLNCSIFSPMINNIVYSNIVFEIKMNWNNSNYKHTVLMICHCG
jgi:hypothetical protein